jgi:hypothetical protein
METGGDLQKTSWEDSPRAFGEISQPGDEMVGTSAAAGLSGGKQLQKGEQMLGKIAAAIVGERLAGRNKGASGAVKGIIVESVAKRLIPTIAAAAILGYAYKKAKDYLNREPAYPSEATPSPPPSV